MIRYLLRLLTRRHPPIPDFYHHRYANSYVGYCEALCARDEAA